MKKTLVIIIVFFIVIAIGIGVFFLLRNGNDDVATVEPIIDQVVETDVEDTLSEPDKPNPYENDSDGDGLTNEEESELGTSSVEFDTDADGLSDVIEMEVVGSDPTNRDTDGDGFSDGVEVLNGYNPLGDGPYVPLIQEEILIDEN